jgi:hypothetical protein
VLENQVCTGKRLGMFEVKQNGWNLKYGEYQVFLRIGVGM